MINEKQYLVIDGGFATELVSSHGKQHIDDDPLWSARLLSDDLTALRQVHLSFLEAGADIIETSSYQASIAGFIKHLSLSHREAHDLIIKSGLIAKEVRDKFWEKESNRKDRKRPLVAGSIGPYGACQHDSSEYTGSYVETMSVEELANWHQLQIKALVESDVDLLAFDTIPAMKEAEAIITVLREFPNVKAWISFSCKDNKRTSHGESIKDATELVLRSPNIVAAGMNCLPPENVLSLVQLISENVKMNRNIVVYPNSGEMWLGGKWQGKKNTTPLHSYVPEWLNAGASWIGGCCRVSPKDISQIREQVYHYVNKLE